jgi:hypothetical protein
MASGNPELESRVRRPWNGYGLSFWYCKCGAARKVTHFTIRGDERIEKVHATPCKRCGTESEPVGWPHDPWLYVGGER